MSLELDVRILLTSENFFTKSLRSIKNTMYLLSFNPYIKIPIVNNLFDSFSCTALVSKIQNVITRRLRENQISIIHIIYAVAKLK